MSKKIVIEFNIEDVNDEQAAKRAMTADAVYNALFDIVNEVFRPARKHGYSDHKLSKLIPVNSELNDEQIKILEEKIELVGELERKFYEILERKNISMDDY